MPKPTIMPDAIRTADGKADAEMLAELRIIRTMLAAFYLARCERYAAKTSQDGAWGDVVRGTVALQYFDNWSHNQRAQCYSFCATFGPSHLLDAICSHAIDKVPAYALMIQNAML